VARVVWTAGARSVFRALPLALRQEIAEKTRLLARFPRLYAVGARGRFRRHRRFVAGDWIVYYRAIGNTAFIRGLWPARLP